jgi:hypothetical protein
LKTFSRVRASPAAALSGTEAMKLATLTFVGLFGFGLCTFLAAFASLRVIAVKRFTAKTQSGAKSATQTRVEFSESGSHCG